MNLDFAINTILSCSYFFFLIIDLYFLISAAIGKMFNLILDLVTPIGIRSKEPKAKIKIHPISADAKIIKVFNII